MRRGPLDSPTVLLDLIESVGAARNGRELSERVIAVAAEAGFPLVAYHLVTAPGVLVPTATHITSYPSDWVVEYVAKNYVSLDPVVAQAKQSVAPFLWPGPDDVEPAAHRLMADAAEAGIANGATVPVRGLRDFALFSVCPEPTRDARRRLEAAMPALSLLAMVTHERARLLLRVVPMSKAPVIRLSRREVDVMTWVAAGKSSWDIGQILGLSEHTVRTYVSTAMTKLGCSDRTQAAVRAVMLGLVEPPA